MKIIEIISAVLRRIGRTLSPRLTTLEARITELEQHPFRYVGTWEGGQYERGEFATHRGSLWHCNTPTKNRPGDSKEWTLAVKRGKDGRNDNR